MKLREQQGVRAPRIDVAVMANASAFVPAPSPFAPAPSAPMPAPGTDPAAQPTQQVQAPMVTPAPGVPIATNGHDLYVHPDEGTARSAWSRRWPILVLAIAGVAILVCAYLLLFAGSGEPAKQTSNAAMGVGPDRMNTMPRIEPRSPTPVPVDPGPTPAPPDDPDLTPPAPAPDPFGSGGPVPPPERFFSTLIDQACQKMKDCGVDLGGGGLGVDFCGQMRDSVADMQADAIRAGRCQYDEASARQCLDAIGSLRCGGGSMNDSMIDLFISAPSCTRALQCH